MGEKMTYEVYLEVALRFAKKGDFKSADSILWVFRKLLRDMRKKKTNMKLAKNNAEHGKLFKNGYRKAFKTRAKSRFKLCSRVIFRARAYLWGVWNAFDFGGKLIDGVKCASCLPIIASKRTARSVA